MRTLTIERVEKRLWTAFKCRDLFFAGVVSLIFGIAVYVAIATRNASNIALIWPANGFLLAALLMRPQVRARYLTSILCLSANVIAYLVYHDAPALAVSFAILNVLEATIAFHLIQKWIGADLAFSSWPTVVKFLAIAGLAAPLVPALLSAIIGHQLLGSDFIVALQTWFFADSLGLLVITPACLVMTQEHVGQDRKVKLGEVICQFCLLALVASVVFAQTIASMLFLLTPVLVSIAFRLGPRYAAIASLLLTAVATVCEHFGMGQSSLLGQEHHQFRIWLVQLFCLVNLLTSLTVAAAVAERDKLRADFEEASKRAEDMRRKLDVALTHMSQGVCLFDADGRITMKNNRFLELYGLSEADVPIGTNLSRLLAICKAAKSAPESSSYIVDLTSESDVDQRLSDGRCIRISQRPLEDKGVVCTYTDITTDKRSEEELLYRTCHDILTDLPNRRMMAERLDQLTALSLPGSSSAALLLDVDHFKSINDTYGHAIGDKLLIIVAERLKQCVRSADLVARLGGDEFAILLSDAFADDAKDVAERILASARLPVAIEGHSFRISLSIGIALAPTDGSSPDALLRAADVALYKAKQSGRDTFSCYGKWGMPQLTYYADHNHARAIPMSPFEAVSPEGPDHGLNSCEKLAVKKRARVQPRALSSPPR